MTNETDIVLLKRDIKELREQNVRHRDGIDKLRALDQQRMRSALVVLGGLVLSLLSYIWFGEKG